MSHAIDDFIGSSKSQPLPSAKHEIVAQSLALGSSRPESYREAGYRPKDDKTAHSNMNTLLKRHPEISVRVAQIQEEMLRVRLKVKGIGEDEIVTALIENIQSAKNITLYDKDGIPIGSKTDHGAINAGLRLVADIRGAIVRRSEQKVSSEKKIDEMTENELIHSIGERFDKLGFEDFDTDALRHHFTTDLNDGSGGNLWDNIPPDPTGSGSADGGDVSEPIEVLPTIPEAASVPLPGEDAQTQAVHGRESAREDGERSGRDRNAPDGSVSEELAGSEVQESD